MQSAFGGLPRLKRKRGRPSIHKSTELDCPIPFCAHARLHLGPYAKSLPLFFIKKLGIWRLPFVIVYEGPFVHAPCCVPIACHLFAFHLPPMYIYTCGFVGKGEDPTVTQSSWKLKLSHGLASFLLLTAPRNYSIKSTRWDPPSLLTDGPAKFKEGRWTYPVPIRLLFCFVSTPYHYQRGDTSKRGR